MIERTMPRPRLLEVLGRSTVAQVGQAIDEGRLTTFRLRDIMPARMALMLLEAIEEDINRVDPRPALELAPPEFELVQPGRPFDGMDGGMIGGPAAPPIDTSAQLLEAVNKTNALLEAVLKELRRRNTK